MSTRDLIEENYIRELNDIKENYFNIVNVVVINMMMRINENILYHHNKNRIIFEKKLGTDIGIVLDDLYDDYKKLKRNRKTCLCLLPYDCPKLMRAIYKNISDINPFVFAEPYSIDKKIATILIRTNPYNILHIINSIIDGSYRNISLEFILKYCADLLYKQKNNKSLRRVMYHILVDYDTQQNKLPKNKTKIYLLKIQEIFNGRYMRYAAYKLLFPKGRSPLTPQESGEIEKPVSFLIPIFASPIFDYRILILINKLVG